MSINRYGLSEKTINVRVRDKLFWWKNIFQIDIGGRESTHSYFNKKKFKRTFLHKCQALLTRYGIKISIKQYHQKFHVWYEDCFEIELIQMIIYLDDV